MPVTSTDALDAALHVSDAAPATVHGVDADSVLTMPESFEEAYRPFDATLDTARLHTLFSDDYLARVDTVASVAPPPAWDEGLEPAARHIRPGKSTVFLAVIALLFVVLAFNFRTLSRLLKFYSEELVSVRRGRDNVFDDRPAGDTRVLILLIVQFVVSGGILLAGAVSAFTGHELMSPVGVAKVIGIVGAYYMFELVAYNTVGYTFAGVEGRREWLRGFNASQALLGVALALPAILVIFYPATTALMARIGVLVYFLARLLFIFKGFRIFYDKIGSLLYFILYLCTLEIIPLILVYNCSVFELV